MVAGHLQQKNGIYYMVLSYPDASGKRKTKWISTKLPIKGNKKRAENLLLETRHTFVPDEKPLENDELFSNYMLRWLEIVRPTVATTTFASYSVIVKSVIVPYFKKTKLTLRGLRAIDIQTFYTRQLKRVSARTVIHYHALLHRALKYAVKIDLIGTNPVDKVDRPKITPFVGSFYDGTELRKLFEASKGTKLEIPVFLGAFYGLRRSEAIGLKWDAIDFQNNTITIKHTIVSCYIDGSFVQEAKDTTKTKSSMRTLPLVPDYICVDEMGNLITPQYVTDTFPKLLEKNGLRKIRFHDLRHSCASLLLANGVPMKNIQEWLGHSDFSTTANIYAHLEYNSKLASADAMISGLQGTMYVIG